MILLVRLCLDIEDISGRGTPNRITEGGVKEICETSTTVLCLQFSSCSTFLRYRTPLASTRPTQQRSGQARCREATHCTAVLQYIAVVQ